MRTVRKNAGTRGDDEFRCDAVPNYSRYPSDCCRQWKKVFSPNNASGERSYVVSSRSMAQQPPVEHYDTCNCDEDDQDELKPANRRIRQHE
jgi:hypothetical protein